MRRTMVRKNVGPLLLGGRNCRRSVWICVSTCGGCADSRKATSVGGDKVARFIVLCDKAALLSAW